MNIYFAIVTLICLSAGFAYINEKFLKLPFVIGLFLLSTILYLLVFSSRIWLNLPYTDIKLAIANAKIDKIILDILLGFLLFAGAMHTNWKGIKKQIKPIAVFALGGVLVSTMIIAGLFYGISQLLQLQIDLIYCLLFGALISPTDPIAVMGILTKANVPKETEEMIVGESLFNDGIGVVVFIALLDTLNSGDFNFPNSDCYFFKKQLAEF